MAEIKTKEEVEKIRAAGKILAKVLKEVSIAAEEGVSGKDLDKLAHDLIIKAGAEPAFLGYQPGGAARPFPATLCLSINDCIVHGVPGSRRLKQGDVVKLDLGVRYKGYCADAAVTVVIDPGSDEARKLIKATEDALEEAIKVARPGNTFGDIGYAISKTASKRGFKVLKELTGHGIGKNVHEEPTVFNEGEPGRGRMIKAGMVLAIEPMFAIGTREIKQLHDDGYATVDGSLSAHSEHTIFVGEDETEILTL
ncbi:MAG: type I methionyl aminopeptidase [Candidatus Harrisonbacteria bacterium CG10_big_fil_rev_8_21_14_0_10_40_38]|uniref:Methionine aminopeptidase n=1 Tax=Candidatus Harrisonbacteria bacterium CG10_big_fil_rev_8_21_14_0_10_40_38 TaxID=1974583 RepID=A0A2H0USH0_9BACT|nr:MAG: type I methionyl aminopeptidase [Candidatus Harrisonbacteria bacterium CG10_big_fil_rev_8_21_14_0_10_40_38]